MTILVLFLYYFTTDDFILRSSNARSYLVNTILSYSDSRACHAPLTRDFRRGRALSDFMYRSTITTRQKLKDLISRAFSIDLQKQYDITGNYVWYFLIVIAKA